jgi:hypothetical protein
MAAGGEGPLPARARRAKKLQLEQGGSEAQERGRSIVWKSCRHGYRNFPEPSRIAAMAIRATFAALALAACQSAPASTPPPSAAAAPPAAPQATQPDATRLPQGIATQESSAGRLPGQDGAGRLPGHPVGEPSAMEPATPCVDRELEKRGLDHYGNAPGTMYPGGTPLFDEKSGKRSDRTQYVYARHPEIATVCGSADAGG